MYYCYTGGGRKGRFWHWISGTPVLSVLHNIDLSYTLLSAHQTNNIITDGTIDTKQML